MTITVGASTATGTYPITVTGNGGGIQQNTTVTLTVTSSAGGGWQQGFDFRNSAGYLTDPAAIPTCWPPRPIRPRVAG